MSNWKKADLHIHTKAGVSDCAFNFSLANLKEYAKNLDILAITNHNLFDKTQYLQIKAALSIFVFPGIEIDLEKGHLLIISSDDDIDDFAIKANQVASLIHTQNDSLKWEDFIAIYTDLSKYLIIPHYNKLPIIKEEILKKLKPDFFVGEVASAKKWQYQMKSEDKVVPVLFSDMRVDDKVKKFEDLTKEELEEDSVIKCFSEQATYIDCENISIKNLKLALSDKKNVSLTKNNDVDEFMILNNKVIASQGLNLIIGERSSGKTYTLENIFKSYNEKSIKYIRQFSIVERSGEKAFEKVLTREQNDYIEKYLEPVKNILPKIIEIDEEENLNKISNYLISLKNFSSSKLEKDVYAKAKLFLENEFPIINNKELEDILKGLRSIYKSSTYSEIIKKHIKKVAISNLFDELLIIYKQKEIDKLCKEKVNELIKSIKVKLKEKTASATIEEISFSEICKDQHQIDSFNYHIKELRKPKTVFVDSYRSFKIEAAIDKFYTGGVIKTLLGSTDSFSDSFNKYNNPYKFLMELKKLDNTRRELLYKAFVEIKINVLNSTNDGVSGGERAEYNLFSELKDARKYDMLLIDEPESSFDNLFLNNTLVDEIREISKKTTVFISTHNNSLATMIRPDNIIFTKKDNGYLVYNGLLESHKLKTSDLKEVKTYDTLMDVLEGGKDAYDYRRDQIYANIKD